MLAVAQVRERLGLLPGRAARGTAQRLERRRPTAEIDVANDLPRNGPSGTYSQRLDVARAPVVHEHDAEDVVARVADGDRLAEPARDADDEAELELDVEPHGSARTRRSVGIRRLPLAGRADDRRAR